jgi:hypothetical protein
LTDPKPISQYLAVLGLCLMVFTGGCTPKRGLKFRFSNPALREASTELRGFVYDLRSESESNRTDLSCDHFNPTGKRPGDAVQRTGLAPKYQFSAAIGEIQFEAEEIANTQQLIILEAWSQKLVDAKTQSTLLAHSCQVYDLKNLQTSVVITLDNFVDSGSKILVPENNPENGERVERFDQSSPLYVSDGVPSRTPFTVQLLDGLQQNVVGQAVHFEIVKGAAQLGTGQRETVVFTDENGVAEITITALANASQSEEGNIELRAYSAGFTFGPIAFYAQAIRSISPKLHRYPLDRNRVDLSDVLTTQRYYPNFQPLISTDLNGDGRIDLITAAGINEHQLFMFYATEQMGYDIYSSPAQDGVVTALTAFNARPGEPISILAAANRLSSSQPEAHLYTWRNSGRRPSESGFEWTVTASKAEWASISLSAHDLDGDLDDDVAAVRCRRPFYRQACISRFGESPDNEIAILLNIDGDALSTVKRIMSPRGVGGFRRSAFADLDQNGSPDLLATTSQQVHGYCGNRNRFDFGFNETFFQNVTLGSVAPIATGRFDDDSLPDLIAVGAFRLSAARAEFRVMHGCQNCGLPPTSCGVEVGPASQALGSRSFAHYQQDLRVVDLNGDGHDDLVNLHRTETALYTYLSSGQGGFALGPRIELPMSRCSDMTIYQQDGSTFVAVIDSDQNTLHVVELLPD